MDDLSAEGDLTPLAAGQIIQQGVGYQLIEADPSLTDGDSVDDETGELVTMPAGTRKLWVFDSWQGVQNSPIPAALKADMAEEMSAAAFQSEEDEGTWVMDEAAALEALAAEADQPPRPGPRPGPRPLPFGLCSKKKKTNSKTKTLDLSPTAFERPAGAGKLNLNLNQHGSVTVTVYYTKKSRCGIPYSFKVDRVETSGNVDLAGSELAYTGTVERKLETSYRLLDISTQFSFYVGPVRVVIIPNLRAEAKIVLSTEIDVTQGVRSAMNGSYAFSYSCTKASCSELRPFQSSLETAPDPVQVVSSVSARIRLVPSLNVAARVTGSLYVKKLRFFQAEVGVNFAIPAELWAYAGNTCGDADGDGLNEDVRAAIFDVSAEIYAYTEISAFGRFKLTTHDLGLPASWNKVLFDPDKMLSRQRNLYRRSFFFRDLFPGGSTALSPVIVTSPTPPQRQASVVLRMRPCVPLLTSPLDYVVDFGSEGPQPLRGAASGAQVLHDFRSWGRQAINAYIARDGSGREVNSPVSTRTVDVVPAPCSWNGASVPHGGSVQAFQAASVGWGEACLSETRSCDNGVLSGSYGYAACSQRAPINCTFNGVTVAEGAAVQAYRSPSSQLCEPCDSERRVCSAGVLSGSFTYSACTPRRPRPGQQCP